MGHFDGFQPLDISIHALREEGDLRYAVLGLFGPISTPALREEGDRCSWTRRPGSHYFYPRPPRGGRPIQRLVLRPRHISTHALREEGDLSVSGAKVAKQTISTHALREEGDLVILAISSDSFISTHALREEGDHWQSWLYRFRYLFLPTPSARRATVIRLKSFPVFLISTHALREEGDGHRRPVGSEFQDFYPRPPRGGRLHVRQSFHH